MGLKDFLRRRRANTEPQGDDFVDNDFIVTASKLQPNCQQVSEGANADATDDQTQ